MSERQTILRLRRVRAAMIRWDEAGRRLRPTTGYRRGVSAPNVHQEQPPQDPIVDPDGIQWIA